MCLPYRQGNYQSGKFEGRAACGLQRAANIMTFFRRQGCSGETSKQTLKRKKAESIGRKSPRSTKDIPVWVNLTVFE